MKRYRRYRKAVEHHDLLPYILKLVHEGRVHQHMLQKRRRESADRARRVEAERLRAELDLVYQDGDPFAVGE